MNDFIIVELTENQKEIATANSYSGATGAWLCAVSPNDFAAASQDKTVVLVVDGRLSVMHQIGVPDFGDAKLLKILPALMDEKTATSGQQNQFALVGDYNPSTQSRAVCVIEKDTLTKVIGKAAELGVIPDVAIPDFAMLEAPKIGARVVAMGGRYVVRTEDGDGFTGEKNIVEAIIGDVDKAEIIEVADWQKQGGSAVGVSGNFLHGEFARKANWINGLIWWKRAAYLAVAVIFLYTILFYYIAVQNYQSTEELYAESESLFKAALPDEPRIVNMEAQLRRALIAQQQTGGGEFFALFSIAAQAIEADPTAAMETVRYDEGDNELLLTVSFPSFTETTKFNEALSGAGLLVTEGSSRQEGGRVYADLRIRMR